MVLVERPRKSQCYVGVYVRQGIGMRTKSSGNNTCRDEDVYRSILGPSAYRGPNRLMRATEENMDPGALGSPRMTSAGHGTALPLSFGGLAHPGY